MSNKEIKEYNVMLNNEQVKALVDELKEKDREIERLANEYNKLSEHYQEARKKRNEYEELKNRTDKIVNDMKATLQKYNYYDDYSVDASMINFWIEMLIGSDKE